MKPDLIIFQKQHCSYLKIETRIRKLQKKVNESQILSLLVIDRQIDKNGDKSYYNSSMYLSPHPNFQWPTKFTLSHLANMI